MPTTEFRDDNLLLMLKTAKDHFVDLEFERYKLSLAAGDTNDEWDKWWFNSVSYKLFTQFTERITKESAKCPENSSRG